MANATFLGILEFHSLVYKNRTNFKGNLPLVKISSLSCVKNSGRFHFYMCVREIRDKF